MLAFDLKIKLLPESAVDQVIRKLCRRPTFFSEDPDREHVVSLSEEIKTILSESKKGAVTMVNS